MLDYMTALHLRFKSPSQRSQDLKQQVTILYRQLASRLRKPERKMLLQLVDLEDALRDQSNLDSFVSGFRLDSGIQRELLEQPPYSFETEEEQRAREMFERKEE